MTSDDLNFGVMRALLWSGVLVIVGLIFAQGYLMGFVPPPPPTLPAEELRHLFMSHRVSIQIGALIQCIIWSFWFTWAVAVTMFIRRMEKAPILTYCSLACNGGGYVFFLLIPMTWAVIAYRADVLDPTIVQVMNDWVWFDWLFTWPPFAIWMAIIGVAVLNDYNAQPVFPRWVAFYNFWCALLIFPAGLIAFFKTGPFAYNGAISFWFAVVVFFSWILVMTGVSFRALAAEEGRQKGGRRVAAEVQLVA